MMTSSSLFDSMEFSLQPEDYLDQTFGLSAEILAADLNTEGGILDLGHSFDDGLKSTNPVSSLGPDESIDDLLFQDKDGASFGEEWMENVDLSVFLDSDNLIVPTSVPPLVEQATQKEEKKNHAFELLKALLTGTVSDVPSQTPSVIKIPLSPEAEVPEVSFLTDELIATVETVQEQSEPFGQTINGHEVAKIKSDPDQPSVVHVGQGLASPLSSDDKTFAKIVSEPNQQSVINIGHYSPLSDSIESLLSSGPSSPEDSVTLHTVDTSQLEESFTLNDSSFDSDFVDTDVIRESKRKSKKQKSRASPYDSDDSIYLNKKDRKKMQNKNAATRYRVKKRNEKETLQQQENNLSDKNKELREKVESLQREIAYMKELMNEIYKAKGVKREIV